MADLQTTIDFIIDDPDLVLTQFDVTTIQRSVTSEVGPFTNLTEDVAEAATLLGTGVGPFNLSGLTLQVIFDEGSQDDITFTGVDPLSPNNVASQIDTAVGAAVAANESSQIRLTSTIPGTDSKVIIVGGDASALTELGFTAAQKDIGADAHVPVVSGTSAYQFIDEDGIQGYWYRTIYKNTTSGALGTPGTAFQASPVSPLDPTSLSLCTIDLVDANGLAREGQKIVFYPISPVLESTTPPNIGIAIGRKPIIMTTDAAGHAETDLVRNLQVRVLFEGTSLIRDITVPDAASCDLLDLIGTAPDIFDVVVPNLPAAPRRTT